LNRKKQEAAEETVETRQEEAAAAEETEAQQPEEQQTPAAEPAAEQDEYMKLAQRIQADFDNYRRRTREAVAEARVDGIVEAVSQLLPVMDNLLRALAAQEGEGLHAGVEMIVRQFVELLGKMGVEEIPAKGEVFDPNVHNAVMTIPAPEGEDAGKVAEVFQAGYRMGNRIVRHSIVQVTE